jgi:hypothetical protein
LKDLRMGGLFRAPKPVVTEPPSDQAQQQTVVQAQAQATVAAEAAGREGRAQAAARASRGLAGTIATSSRGVLDPLPAFATRKTLLGE